MNRLTAFVAANRRMIGLMTVGLAALVLAAACGGSSDERLADVRSLDEIITGEIEVTELTPRSAVVRVDTRIAVICSVVYGLDESYGAQSTDVAMAGLPHMDHNAPLRGLQPDSVYHLRVQGTGPDGTLYVSEDISFRTPPEEESSSSGPTTELGRNLASLEAGARVVAASSFFANSESWRPENAIDGDPQTQWSSAGDGDAAFITIELAERAELTAVGLWSRTMGATAQIIRFRVVTEDGEVLGPFDVADASDLFTFPVQVTARTLRFEVVESSGGNTGVVELVAFGRVGN